jgi:hypothetical protein
MTWNNWLGVPEGKGAPGFALRNKSFLFGKVILRFKQRGMEGSAR